MLHLNIPIYITKGILGLGHALPVTYANFKHDVIPPLLHLFFLPGYSKGEEASRETHRTHLEFTFFKCFFPVLLQRRDRQAMFKKKKTHQTILHSILTADTDTHSGFSFSSPLHTVGEQVEISSLPLRQERVSQLQHVAVHDAVLAKSVICTNITATIIPDTSHTSLTMHLF